VPEHDVGVGLALPLSFSLAGLWRGVIMRRMSPSPDGLRRRKEFFNHRDTEKREIGKGKIENRTGFRFSIFAFLFSAWSLCLCASVVRTNEQLQKVAIL